ncbi:DUF3795 domain-containing protein [Oscillospiraceae bacterium CM]|nr:DUF3795 domain-containing protein [Oscillospiraceae bacterium CM]
MMSYCGIVCSDCPAYKATMADDDDLRRQTAAEWSAKFHADVLPDSIRCRGCRSDELFDFSKVCAVRQCCMEKKLEHCGVCPLFPCSLEEKILKHVPGVQERLESLRRERGLQ